MRRVVFMGILFALLTTRVSAQHGHGTAVSLPTTKAPTEAAQFNFLVGQWEVTAEPRVEGLAARIHGNPKLPGIWKAWPGLDGWGIEDELRLTDPSGNPISFSHNVRSYDASASRWNIVVVDVYRAKITTSTAVWRDKELHLESRGTDAEDRAYVSRGRFYDISPTSFRLTQDRSFDDGKTWTEGFLKLEAKRVAASAPR